MARNMVAVLLCIAAMAVVAQATEADKKAPASLNVEIAGGPTILEVAAVSALTPKISKGEKRHFPGDCEVVCKDKCDVKVITKCKKVPVEYELCEHKPIIRIKKVCKDVCKDPSHGVSVYHDGHKGLRRLFTTIDLASLLTGDKKDEGNGKEGKSTGYKVCEEVCKEEEVEDVKETCKTVQKEKEECKDTEDKKCTKVCKCVVQSPGSGSGDMDFSLDSFKMVQITKDGKPLSASDLGKDGKGDALFSVNANIDKKGGSASVDAKVGSASVSANVDAKDGSASLDKTVGH